MSTYIVMVYIKVNVKTCTLGSNKMLFMWKNQICRRTKMDNAHILNLILCTHAYFQLRKP